MTATDYDPFGMQLDDRNLSSSTYRFGFNGKENDPEVAGQQDYGFRIYDRNLARFKSVDPLTKSYPWYTPFQFAGNSPIQAIDLDGKEREITINKIGKGSDGYFLISSYTVSVENKEANAFVHYNDYSNQEKYRDVGKLQVYEFVGAKGNAKIESYSVGFFESFFGGDVRQNGVAFVMEDGQGRENRTAINYEEINIDDLMSALGVAKEANTPGFKQGKFLSEKLQELAEDINEVLELADFASDSYGTGKALHDADYEKPFEFNKGVRTDRKAVDSSCIDGCGGKPHPGARYVTIDANGNILETKIDGKALETTKEVKKQ